MPGGKMERRVDFEEISDGKRYGAEDMVKAGCGGCEGCSACCRGMGNSIVLDPYDVYRLTVEMGSSFEALMQGKIQLHVVDGVILPNLAMNGPDEACAFLDENGRCSIHPYRPGICRLFPLGRIYENGSFQYFLQVHECRKENRTKVRVRQQVDTPDFRRYEAFVEQWHYFLKELEARFQKHADAEEEKRINLLVLKVFFLQSYGRESSFYVQFQERMELARKMLEA